MIVASILLALAVDATWARYQEDRTEATEILRLEEEMTWILPRVQYDARGLESLEAHVTGLLGRLREAPDGAVVTIPDSLLVALVFVPSRGGGPPALDALVESGRLSLITDRAVREGIIRWSNRSAAALAYQDIARGHYRDRVLSVLGEQSELEMILAYRQPDQASGSDFPWEQARSTTDIRNTRELRNLVVTHLLHLQTARFAAGSAEGALVTLIDALDAAGGGSSSVP